MPFQRLKIRLKKEIVTLGATEADPTRQVGIYVDPADWNELIAAPDTLVIDTRNAFEVAMGTFDGAVDPGIRSFGQFKDFAARHLDPAKHRRIAMFCTGGIRCEKASSYLLARGFAEVYHLKGGILKYLEGVPEAESRWRGECFVFDERVALGHGLRERQNGTAIPMSDDKTLGDRIDALEAKLMFQDETIETLNKTITEQWLKIDALTRQVPSSSERLQEAEAQRAGPRERTAAALLSSDSRFGWP